MRFNLAFVSLVALSLSGCASMGRFPGQTDSECVRAQMAAGNNGQQLPFDMAAGRCHQYTEGQGLTEQGSHEIPLDFRDDPELQKMAENPEINDSGYSYVPRDSKAPLAGPRWHIQS